MHDWLNKGVRMASKKEKQLKRLWKDTKEKSKRKLLPGEKKPGLLRRIFRRKKAPKLPEGATMKPPDWWQDFPVGTTHHHAGRRLQVVDRYADCVVYKVGELTNAEVKRRARNKKKRHAS